jgi:hypothetical protein
LQRIPLPPLPHFRQDRAGAAPPAEPVVEVKPDRATAAPAVEAPRKAVPPVREEDYLFESDLAPVASLPPGPGHEGLPPPVLEVTGPERTGDSGATIMNDLVDQIERDIERDLGRVTPDATLPAYRLAVGCSLDPTVRTGGWRPPPPHGMHRR